MIITKDNIDKYLTEGGKRLDIANNKDITTKIKKEIKFQIKKQTCNN